MELESLLHSHSHPPSGQARRHEPQMVERGADRREECGCVDSTRARRCFDVPSVSITKADTTSPSGATRSRSAMTAIRRQCRRIVGGTDRWSIRSAECGADRTRNPRSSLVVLGNRRRCLEIRERERRWDLGRSDDHLKSASRSAGGGRRGRAARRTPTKRGEVDDRDGLARRRALGRTESVAQTESAISAPCVAVLSDKESSAALRARRRFHEMPTDQLRGHDTPVEHKGGRGARERRRWFTVFASGQSRGRRRRGCLRSTRQCACAGSLAFMPVSATAPPSRTSSRTKSTPCGSSSSSSTSTWRTRRLPSRSRPLCRLRWSLTDSASRCE